MKLACIATALFAAGALASASALAAPSADAVEALQDGPLYLPASPGNPGGLQGYEHSAQFDENIEAHAPGKNKALKEKKDKIKAKLLKNAKAGPKVKAGSYTLAPAPHAEPDL